MGKAFLGYLAALSNFGSSNLANVAGTYLHTLSIGEGKQVTPAK